MLRNAASFAVEFIARLQTQRFAALRSPGCAGAAAAHCRSAARQTEAADRGNSNNDHATQAATVIGPEQASVERCPSST